MCAEYLEQAIDWLNAHIRKEASLTVEKVMNGIPEWKRLEMLDWWSEQELERETEAFLHVSKRREFSEICVSLPMEALSEVVRHEGWEEAEDILRAELAPAGLLREDLYCADSASTKPGKTGGDMLREEAGSGEAPGKEKRRSGRTAQEIMEEMDDEERDLFETLRTLRKEIAVSKSVAPYVIFSNRALEAMCREHPGTIEELLALPGVGVKNSSAYGAQFLDVIQKSAAAVV